MDEKPDLEYTLENKLGKNHVILDFSSILRRSEFARSWQHYSEDLEKSIQGIYDMIQKEGDCASSFEKARFCHNCYYSALDTDRDWVCGLKENVLKKLRSRNNNIGQKDVLPYIKKMCEKHLQAKGLLEEKKTDKFSDEAKELPKGNKTEFADQIMTDNLYSQNDLIPEEIIEFPQGTLIEYHSKAAGEKIYAWQEKGQNTMKGVLRFETGAVKTSEQVLYALHRTGQIVGFKSDLPEKTLPESLGKIADLILESKKEKQEFSGSNISLCFDHTDYVTKLQEELAGFYEMITFVKIGSAITLSGSATSIAMALTMAFDKGTMLDQNIVLGIAGPFLSLLMGFFGAGVATVCSLFSQGSIAKTRDIARLTKNSRKQKNKLAKLYARYETSTNWKDIARNREKLNEQTKNLSDLGSILQAAIEQNCISISYTGKPEEVMSFFRYIQGNDSALEQIQSAEVISQKTKTKKSKKKSKTNADMQEKLNPVQTLDEIMLSKNWIKDEQYGREIDGRYMLKERIGEGGLCKVYRAVRKLDDQEVAIKFEKPEAKALREKEELIKLLKTVRHEHLIETHDANLQASPAYIVMDLVQGADLGRILDFARSAKQYLRLENIMCIARQAGEALQALHSNGTHKKVIHHDVKPANILIDKDGKTYLGDCDVADVEHDISSMLSEMTSQKASGAGTFDYRSPERRGKDKATLDERSDIYSFGVLLYEMLAGQVPMTPDGLDRRTDLPEGLKKLVCKCVSINPENRYGSMSEVMGELNKLQIKSEPAKLIIQEQEKKEEPMIKESEATQKNPVLQAAEQLVDVKGLHEELDKTKKRVDEYLDGEAQRLNNLTQQHEQDRDAEDSEPEDDEEKTFA